MLKSNLSVLMAERGLKIVDLYNATGISKNTLMSLSENTSKGVQFETVDKLCNYLGVTPADFFVYAPYIVAEIKFEKNAKEKDEFNLIMILQSGDRIKSFTFEGALYDKKFRQFMKDDDITALADYSKNGDCDYFIYLSDDINGGNENFVYFFNKFPQQIKREIIENIFKKLSDNVFDGKIDNGVLVALEFEFLNNDKFNFSKVFQYKNNEFRLFR